MPTVYLTNDIVEMRAKGTYFGEPFEILEHFRQKDAPKTAIDWANAMRTYFINEFTAAMVPQARWISVSVRRIRPLPKTREETTAIVALPGIHSGEGMPHQICTLYKKRTALTAPSGRGRVYIPGTPQSWFVNGVWTNVATTIMQSIVNRLFQWSVSGGYSFAEWGVASRRVSPVAYNGIHEIKWSGLPCTMRSRRPQIF